MEKQTSVKNPPPPAAGPAPLLSSHEWETLIDDFQSGAPSRRSRWLQLPLIDLALHNLLRKDFPSSMKPQLLIFLEESSDLLFLPSPSTSLPPLIDFVRSFLLSPADSSQPLLKEQAMVSATSIAIVALDSPSPHILDPLVELLLSVANRPNHGIDRHTRAIACDCLRELELAHPLLLSDAAGHLWSLAQAERTHAAQSYLLLLATVVASISIHGLLSSSSSILSTAIPLVPFNSPRALLSPRASSDPSDLSLREVRRVVAFLLERPQALTPCATMELVAVLSRIIGALERRVPAVAALLKVQFSGLLHCYDPLLCHVVLMLHSRFSDAFAGDDELGIARRLALIPKEAHQPLVFRLLALHWLLGSPRLARNKGFLPSLVHCFYPSIFDPLALKAAKLDALACVAAHVDGVRSERDAASQEEGKKDTTSHELGNNGRTATVAVLFDGGLICVSAFKWLPPWSTETSVAFRTLHKFLVGVFPHNDGDSIDDKIHSVFGSSVFCTLQDMLVNLALEHRRLVSVIATFVDRLIGCKAHQVVGQRLLQILDEKLLPNLEINYQLASYFPIFERVAANDSIPPRVLLELLTRHMLYLTGKHDLESGLRSWSQGSKVLGICRTMLMHHHSSRVFRGLSNLLAITCQFFPDLEVRDTARIYLRMLLCIPGKKLRATMNLGGQLPGVSPSSHPTAFFEVPSSLHSQDNKKLSGVSQCMHLRRAIPLLVKQSWSLILPNLESHNDETSYFEGIRDIIIPSTAPEREIEPNINRAISSEEPLRMTDSKVAETLRVLRMHFSCIPDYRHMPGTKIRIPCILRFEAESFNQIWGSESPSLDSGELDNLPALYATTITFKSTAKYGSIPACRIPFLLGEPSKTGFDIVPIGSNFEEVSRFHSPLTIELEPREPSPGLIDAALTANIENGQIISGSLQSISVGIEDMFLKASLPSDVPDDMVPDYYLDLFHALWEACGSSTNTGRETFLLQGGKGAAAIYGTRSVKFLDVAADSLINAVEQYLTPFVVSVSGQLLVNKIEGNGIVKNVIWVDYSSGLSVNEDNALVPYSDHVPLQLGYIQDESDGVLNPRENSKRNLGTVLVLIFLPPRFHLLFLMEVGEVSTFVRIRTDHWPCLAYVDEYLEALIA
ncbi:hypothetical protein AXF42_Ash013307 [Apostasia shenzhenica]|uniref:FHA domain-containing protein n=1 Tax=Apostasia shenzhenica TaxID=1088818 RepID=A0A2I0BBL4_9ASPA|nr:hypothetical protein AXF42_Ash013307 [Apostasia shenzhenica]